MRYLQCVAQQLDSAVSIDGHMTMTLRLKLLPTFHISGTAVQRPSQKSNVHLLLGLGP